MNRTSLRYQRGAKARYQLLVDDEPVAPPRLTYDVVCLDAVAAGVGEFESPGTIKLDRRAQIIELR